MIKQLTIGRLAEITGTTSDTLRYYEKMRLITSTSRSPAGYRLYDEDIIRVIRFIRGAKALNFTLVEIEPAAQLNFISFFSAPSSGQLLLLIFTRRKQRSASNGMVTIWCRTKNLLLECDLLCKK